MLSSKDTDDTRTTCTTQFDDDMLQAAARTKGSLVCRDNAYSARAP